MSIDRYQVELLSNGWIRCFDRKSALSSLWYASGNHYRGLLKSSEARQAVAEFIKKTASQWRRSQLGKVWIAS